MLNESYYLYYGSIIPISEISSRMHATRNLRKDIYCYIFDKDLQYRRVGNVRTVWRICVGYEIQRLTNTLYDLNKTQCFLPMTDLDANLHKLSNDLRIKIETSLISIGCITRPRYWVFYNYFYDDVDVEENKK